MREREKTCQSRFFFQRLLLRSQSLYMCCLYNKEYAIGTNCVFIIVSAFASRFSLQLPRGGTLTPMASKKKAQVAQTCKSGFFWKEERKDAFCCVAFLDKVCVFLRGENFWNISRTVGFYNDKLEQCDPFLFPVF